MPDPRWLDREGVAHYLSLRADAVSRLVRDGRLPAPAYHLGERRPRWDRLALDAVFSGGVASTDPSEAFSALAKELAASPGRARRQSQAR